MENNLQIDDIIEMGGHVELTGPLLAFVAESGIEPVNGTEYPMDKSFAIVWLSTKSKLKILNRKINGIYGVIIEAYRPVGIVDFDEVKTEAIPPDEIVGSHFVTSWDDLEQATKIKRGKRQ